MCTQKFLNDKVSLHDNNLQIALGSFNQFEVINKVNFTHVCPYFLDRNAAQPGE